MPCRPAAQCPEPGCPRRVVRRGRCEPHAAAATRAYEGARPSRQARGYDADWERVRLQVLDRDDHRCRIGLPGCRGAATTVDHIIPLVRGGARLDPANLRAACLRCNSGLAAKARRP